MEIPVVFGREGRRLVGIFHIADCKVKNPGVVLFHGFTGNKIEPHRLFVKIGRRLASSGINVLRFDFYGSGDSEGEFIEMTFSGEVEDAFTAVDFLKQQSYVDSSRIGILGLSMGGAIASYVAGDRGDIKSTVLLSAVANLSPLAERIKTQYPEERIRADGFVDYAGWQLSINFIEELPNICPVDKIKNFRGPVFIIHGSKDDIVPVDAAYNYYNALKERPAETRLFIIEDADHTFNSVIWEKMVIDNVIDWFSKTL
ncbi:MAG: alpha/beta fold hydrolase [bacterium]|nr:alpha/beta fold hydrolase [bacterium]